MSDKLKKNLRTLESDLRRGFDFIKSSAKDGMLWDNSQPNSWDIVSLDIVKIMSLIKIIQYWLK